MLTRDELLAPIAARRTDEIVVTCMSVVRPWGAYSSSPLDLASADSAMGHTADVALGLAMAQPSRRVLCLNGDGSMLMTLGTLATVVESGVPNLILFVVANGGYEITGNHPVPGRGRMSYSALARDAGFPRVFSFEEAATYEASLDEILCADGPVLVEVAVAPGTEGPISRSAGEASVYLRTSLFQSSRTLRSALLSPEVP